MTRGRLSWQPHLTTSPPALPQLKRKPADYPSGEVLRLRAKAQHITIVRAKDGDAAIDTTEIAARP